MFVFLIDSNSMISDWLERQAKHRGEKFYSMGTLLDAPFFIEDLAPDVLVLDGKTANYKPQEFIEAIISYPILATIPVIGFGDTLPEWCAALNLKGHLKKPVNPEHFFDQVKQLLASQAS
jgi:CheY-like chemotaxis protein